MATTSIQPLLRLLAGQKVLYQRLRPCMQAPFGLQEGEAELLQGTRAFNFLLVRFSYTEKKAYQSSANKELSPEEGVTSKKAPKYYLCFFFSSTTLPGLVLVFTA